MTRLIAPTTLGLLALALLITSLAPGETAAIVFGALAAAFPVGLAAFAIAIAPDSRPRRLRTLGLVTLLVVLEGGLATLLLLRGSATVGPGGLPLAPLVQIVVLWLLPLVLVVWVYAATFDGSGAPPSPRRGGRPSPPEDDRTEGEPV